MLTSAPPREPEVEVAVEPAFTLLPDSLPDVEHLVTEDDTPVDNIFSEKQQRLLTESLYSSWAGPGEGRPFLAAADVGVFASVRRTPPVPDVFLSLDVEVAEDWWAKHNRCYMLWEFGKPPDVVIEIVSNLKGKEAGRKLREYARMRVTYYVIFDPLQQVQDKTLRVYTLRDGMYVETQAEWLPLVGLGLTLWQGAYEGKEGEWLRWCDREGNVIPTGAERAEQEHQRAERLAAQLRALGVELQDD